jgi:hypothetical protein
MQTSKQRSGNVSFTTKSNAQKKSRRGGVGASEDTMSARIIHTLAIAAAAACCWTVAMAQVPAAVGAPGETTVATFKGEGRLASFTLCFRFPKASKGLSCAVLMVRCECRKASPPSHP